MLKLSFGVKVVPWAYSANGDPRFEMQSERPALP